ncbi:MAG TPA: TraB/GumN family protein [Steroidobacteraceae bacterium]|nr:TraB/GumN family protein [Steroidobacteraceae bacterium]
MQVIVVTGVQPGPGLWKVSKGNHVMWILGEVSPYPRQTQWNSKVFDRLLQGSQELIIDFSGYWTMDPSDSAAYARAEKLPEGTTLKDTIPPQLHERVETLANLFGATDLEELYPFAATNRLVSSAMRKLDLTGFSARFAADALGKKRRVKTTYFSAPEPPFKVRLQSWQDASNVVCLERLANAIKDGGNGVKRLANAWSIGDIDALRRLVPPYSFSRDGFRADECAAAMRGGEQPAREYNAKRQEAWLAAAERALWYNKRTMAVVLMSEIFAPDGYLAGLRAKGYEIEEPK